MDRFFFLETEDSKPLLVDYGEIGTCQLLADVNTRQLYALKMAPRGQASQDVKCLTSLKHPNIIRVIEYFHHQDSTLIIFQFLANGDLYSKIVSGELKQHHVIPIFKRLCSAVNYIHQNGIIHRNLKSEAILLDANMNPRLIDFGLAARLTTRKTFCGCQYYMAPEILNSQPYGASADVWALGIILYEMVHRQLPFSGQQPHELLNSINSCPIYKQSYSPQSPGHLICWMLTPDPKYRPSLTQVLEHQFLDSSLPWKEAKHNPRESPHLLRSCPGQQQLIGQRNCQAMCQSGRMENEESTIEWVGKFFKNKLKALLDGENLALNDRYNYTAPRK